MLTTNMFIAIIGLCATFFSLGYTVGCNTKAKK